MLAKPGSRMGMGRFNLYWAFDVTYFTWIGMEIWILSRDRRAASGIRADRGSFWFIIGIFTAGLTAAFYAPYLSRATRISEFRYPIILLGLFLAWVGIAFRLWAVAVLGRFFRITVMLQDNHELITKGPYRYLRHPSYT